MALGTFVFVTVLIFGIHFAEVGHLWLKVQESANAAMWDATSQQMHDTFAHDWTLWEDTVSFANTEANARYADFDATRTGATTLNHVFTTAQGLDVECEELSGAHRLSPLGPHASAARAYPSGMSGIVCNSSARIMGLRIPRRFLDGNMSQARHWEPVVIRACAVGRPSGGTCPGRLGMLLDDWGYSGPQEAQQCPLAWEGGVTCDNQGYWDQVAAVYERVPLAGSGTRLAGVVAGASPIDEDHMYLSFRGRESEFGPFYESVQLSHGDLYWETTPYANQWNDRYDAPRTNCWLGKACP
jgi:hypothetical protein